MSSGGLNGLDAPMYAYVGWAMKNGAIPYLDVLDNKGPLFFLIQMFAMIISQEWGLFAVRFLFMSVFAVFVYKIGQMLCNKNKIIAFLATAWTLMTLSAFEFGSSGSNWIEYFALPFVAIAIYYILKIIQSDKTGWVEPMIIGACASASFLMRSNFPAPILAFCAAVFIARLFEKRVKESFAMLGWFTLGFVLLIIPIAVWLASNGALMAAVESVYVPYNIDPGWARRLELIGIFFMMLLPGLISPINVGFFLFVLVQIFRKQIKDQKEKLVLLGFCTALIITLASNMITGDAFSHYLISFVPLFIFPSVYLFTWIIPSKKGPKKKKAHYEKMVGLSIAVFALLFIPLFLRLQQDMSDTLQWEGFQIPYVDIIQEHTDEDDLVQLVGSSWVNSIFVTQRRTASRHFYQSHEASVSDDFIKAIYLEAVGDVMRVHPRMIIIGMSFLNFINIHGDPVFDDFAEFLFENYTLIDRSSYFGYGILDDFVFVLNR
jgi:hypothetical protein